MKRLTLIAIPLAALVLVFIWFHEGYILGTAEAEIPFYKLESFQKKTEYTWTDFHLGKPTTLTIASSPTWWLLANLQKIGIPGFVIEAALFWVTFFVSGIGIFFFD